MEKFDVLIVGGGPAGASCARRLRQAGASCLILDQCTFPRNKPCAGWITPDVWPLLDLEPGDYPHSLTIFKYLRISIRGIPLLRPGRQFAIRRYEFDDWLLQQTGVLVVQHHVRDVSKTDQGFLIDGTWFGKHLIGAGGTHCPVYHRLFKPRTPRRPTTRIAAMEEEFQYTWRESSCRLWFMENGLPGYAWYVPKSDGWINVGVGGMIDKMKERGTTIYQHWNLLIDKLDRSGLVRNHSFHPVSHIYHLNQHPPQIQYGDAYLVGDAAGLATVDMGEGISPAIHSGILAAESILNSREYSISSIPRYSLLPRLFQPGKSH